MVPESEETLTDAEILIQDAETELERLRVEGEEARLKLEQLRANYREVAERKAALARRLADDKRKVEAEELERTRQEALARPTEIRACDFDMFFVNVKVLPDLREDITNLLRGIYGRQFDAYTGVNRIPAEYWKQFREQVVNLKNVKLTHLMGVEAKITRFETLPDFLIELDGKQFKITSHPKAPTNLLRDIPGAEYFRDKLYWNVPYTEGWRVYNALDGYKGDRGAVWKDDALKLVEAEMERRTKMDTIALQQDSDLVIPFLNGHTPRPFQKVGVEFINLSNGRALVADQMGLGKTWEAIGYALLHNLRVVVICPAHLKANWSREIIQLTGEIPTILQGREPDDFAVQALLLKKPRWTIINYDILGAKTQTPEKVTVDDNGLKHITPPKDRYLWADLLNMSKPDLIITDEAHYTKNTDSNRSKAVRLLNPAHRLALTGTPILNRPGEYWAILNWLRPELFPNEDKFIYQYTYNGKTAKNTAELREVLKPIMIRRLKKDVVSELPPINRIYNLHELSSTGREMYKKVLAGVYEKIDSFGNKVEQNITSILAEIGKLKEVCAHDKVDAVVDLAAELYDTEQDATDAKLGNKKVLIFSQYKDVVRKIALRLGREAIYWTGDTAFEERTRLENEFQTNPDVHFLVVSLMTGQTGLNLTAAGHVVFADLYWTPAAHAQAEERAYGRLSNMHGCDSYYLVATDTIEDWIQELLAAKLQTINAVVEGIDAERDPAIGMEIIRKLREMRNSL